MCVGTWIREHVGTQNTLEHEPVIMQYTLTREHISAWGTWVRKQKIKKGTVASEHNVSTQDTQFSRLTVCKQQMFAIGYPIIKSIFISEKTKIKPFSSETF